MAEVLFCPFCGEAFEGEPRCPEHELALVPWAQLARRERVASDEDDLPWHSLRAGRGFVFAGALVLLLAFLVLPLARVDGAVKMGGSMLVLALHGTPRLWLIPAAAWAELAILRRRTVPLQMRRARVAVAFLAWVPVLALWWTWSGVRAAVALVAERDGADLPLALASGGYAVALASGLLFLGGLRLGGALRSDESSADHALS